MQTLQGLKRRVFMPVKKVRGGYKWGEKGKVYRTRGEAIKQGRAIEANKKKKGKG